MLQGSRQGEAPADTDESIRRQVAASTRASWRTSCAGPCQGRPYHIRYAFKLGWTVEQVHQLTHIDPWFLRQMADLVSFEGELLAARPRRARRWCSGGGSELVERARLYGYSRSQLAHALQVAEPEARPLGPGKLLQAGRHLRGGVRGGDALLLLDARVRPSWWPRAGSGVSRTEDELAIGTTPHVVVVGGGPNRIGQGIEFDYCCVHAAQAAAADGLRTVMINSNPETVSTDYDTSDLLFFEPLTLEDVERVLAALTARASCRGDRAVRRPDAR